MGKEVYRAEIWTAHPYMVHTAAPHISIRVTNNGFCITCKWNYRFAGQLHSFDTEHTIVRDVELLVDLLELFQWGKIQAVAEGSTIYLQSQGVENQFTGGKNRFFGQKLFSVTVDLLSLKEREAIVQSFLKHLSYVSVVASEYCMDYEWVKSIIHGPGITVLITDPLEQVLRFDLPITNRG